MKKKILVITSLIIILSAIGYFYYTVEYRGQEKYLVIKLNGEKEVTINYKEEYQDSGAKATYKNKDITKDIETSNNINYNKIGNYEIIYKIKYKKQEKKITRKINIVDKENPVIELNGNSEITIYKGSKYNEQGVKITDNYDENLIEKVEIDNNINTNKTGNYEITYKVKDSSGNEAIAKRKVKVIEKIVSNDKVAVLNYHFFYKNEGECNESICLNINKFEEQIKYLKDNNFKILTMDEFINFMYGNLKINQKAVLLTIDDGAFGTGMHNGNYLIPVLEKYQVPATLFLITGWWDINNYKSEYLNIESHTHDLHIEENCGYRSKVNCVSKEDLLKDLKQSINITNSTKAFCFPFYEYSNTSISAIKEIGFKVSFVGGNKKVTSNNDKYKIPRYVVYKNTSLDEFKKMVN